MHRTAYKIIAENFRELYESSTSGDIVNSLTGGPEIMKALHTTHKAPADLKYQPVAKIGWKDIKDAYKNSWILIQADKGTGAIKFANGHYYAMLSVGGAVQNFDNSRSNFIIDWLKQHLGGLRKFYVAMAQPDVSNKQRSRAERKQDAGGAMWTQKGLAQKFRPLVVKTMTHAVADIKGMAGTMLKNGNYDGAIKKIQKLQSYEDILYKLETKDSDSPDFSGKINDAVILTAHHFYPDIAGDVSRGYGGYRSGGGRLQIQNQEAVTQLFNDINAGQQDKLGTLLAFFKRGFTA
jgi:hypothetical protein